MFLIILLVLVTTAISGSAAYFSVYGLAQIFTAAFIPSVIMGASLEAGKLVGASFLYQYWNKIGKILKGSLLALIAGLMIFTSMGIFGFLSSAYQTGSLDMKDTEQRIEYLTQQKTEYENRLAYLDEQIKNVPSAYVSKKIELMKTIDADKKQVLSKLEAVTDQRNELLTKKITTEAKVGPIIYVAKALNQPVDNSIVYFIVMIMFIFDPLAVTLTIATNVAIKDRREEKLAKQSEVELTQPVTPSIVEPQPTIEPTVTEVPSHETVIVQPAVDVSPLLNDISTKLDGVVNAVSKSQKRKDIINSMRDI